MNSEDKKIIFTSQEKVEQLQPWLDQIKKAIHIKRWWISDKSTIGDFCLSEEQLKETSGILGIPIDHNDYLIEIAEKLKNS